MVLAAHLIPVGVTLLILSDLGGTCWLSSLGFLFVCLFYIGNTTSIISYSQEWPTKSAEKEVTVLLTSINDGFAYRAEVSLVFCCLTLQNPDCSAVQYHIPLYFRCMLLHTSQEYLYFELICPWMSELAFFKAEPHLLLLAHTSLDPLALHSGVGGGRYSSLHLWLQLFPAQPLSAYFTDKVALCWNTCPCKLNAKH